MNWIPTAVIATPAIGSGTTFAAATEVGSTSPIAIVAYVVGGLIAPTTIAWMFINNKLHSDGEFQRVVAESERRRQDNETLRDAASMSIVPLVQRSTTVLEDVVALIRNEARLPPPRGRTPRRGQSDETPPPP